MHSAAVERVSDVVSRIHGTSHLVVAYVTGGGIQTLSWLLTQPGASQTVLEATVPYAPPSLAQLLGSDPASAASAPVAEALARRALRRAAALAPLGAPLVGLGVTAALVASRPRRGARRAHVAVCTGWETQSWCLEFGPGRGDAAARERAAEDELVSRLSLDALAAAMGLESGLFREAACEADVLEPGCPKAIHAPETRDAARSALEALRAGSVASVELSNGLILVDAPRPGRLYLSGSFNPLHHGHTNLLKAAAALRPCMEPCFELSIGNADKGMLEVDEVWRRMEQFAEARLPVVVTQAPLFTEKAALFPNSCFVVGFDTAKRLLDPKYYPQQPMEQQLSELSRDGCSFLVAPRLSADTGDVRGLADLAVPRNLQDAKFLEAIPDFRADISSTELRQKACRKVCNTTG